MLKLEPLFCQGFSRDKQDEKEYLLLSVCHLEIAISRVGVVHLQVGGQVVEKASKKKIAAFYIWTIQFMAMKWTIKMIWHILDACCPTPSTPPFLVFEIDSKIEKTQKINKKNKT